MCGIAGLIRLDGALAGPADEAVVRAMTDLTAYRGPDDSGVRAIGNVVLGSRRLAIQDLSPAGHMPMADPSGRWWIAYNGETYNFHEVRAELEQLGVAFRSHGDTEVLLHAWIRWGARCLDRFAGMFAFAIADLDSGETVLVRDRFGVKPVYWTIDGDRLLFGSEIKALMRQRRHNAVDRQSLAEWWLYRNVDALTPETLVEGIVQLLPGHLARVRNGQVRTEAWYSPAEQVDAEAYARFARAQPGEIVDTVERQLDESIRLRLVSDVPVGTLLSGGLDSSLVTAMAAKHSKALTAFHVSVTGHVDMDERRFAEELTRHHAIPFVPMDLTADNFRANLAHVTWLEDFPLTHANSVAYYLISQVARSHGVIVVQSGEGADELFGGYAWNYRRKRMLLKLEPWLRRLPGKVNDLLTLLVYAANGLPVTAHRFREALPPALALIDRYARLDAEDRAARAYAFVADPTERAVLGGMLGDLGVFLSPLLRRLDRTTMGASIECREPFLDHRLVHTAINLPLDYKLGARADKWVLKQVATRHMPSGLIWRKKMGFPLPLADYIAPMAAPSFFAGGFCEGTLGLGRRGLERMLGDWQRWSHGFFGLVSLEMWGRMNFMGESPATVTERIQSLAAPAGRGSPARADAAPAASRAG
ncbi:MAG: asparagine synthase (glutamine-hydrolyzing) [Geminicoccaceae bacterium]